MKGSGAPNEILTYGYVKPRDLWFPTEESLQPISLGSPSGSGLYPSGMLARTLRLRNLLEHEHTEASTQGSRAHLSLRLPIDEKPEPGP
jgi:hypothetical protein